MKTKEEITQNWLPRYTGLPLEAFPPYLLLTNFDDYVHRFAAKFGVPVNGENRPFRSAISGEVGIINFGMGSPNAATVVDLLSAISPKAVLFLGKCGGLKKRTEVGDFILPIGAIRGEGTSDAYFPKEVPALPAFSVQRAASHVIRMRNLDYWTGTVYTTNRRVWEHDEAFKAYLNDIRAIIAGSHGHLHPGGWLLLEHGYDQASGVRSLLQQAGFVDVDSRKDLAGIERCSGGRLPVAR
jgi:AMP nucleosidase